MKSFLLISALAFSFILKAQPGKLDASFNPGLGFDDEVFSVVIQQNGKIIAGGTFLSFDLTSRKGIARLNTNGTLDGTFSPAGSGFDGFVDHVALQADGKMVVTGGFNNFNGVSRNHIARLTSDGALDATFNPGTGFDDNTSSIVVQPDGKILVTGNFTTYNGVSRNAIVRINSDGSLDATFNPGTGFDNIVTALTLQADGKILAGGYFSDYNGSVRSGIIRINSDGNIDGTFNPGSGVDFAVYTIKVQPDSKIILGGYFTKYNGVTHNYIVRVNSDGSIDPNFNAGTGFDNTVNTIALQADGKIVVGGDFNDFNGVSRNYIARLNSNGSIDAVFNPGIGFNFEVWSLALQSDGAIVTGGTFTSFASVNRNRIARIQASTSVDIQYNDDASGISLYPNPGSGLFYFDSEQEITAIEIMNTLGQVVMTLNPNSKTFEMDLSNELSGIYHVNVFTQNSSSTFKIIKQ